MVKVIWIARFRPDISKEAGRAHWRDTHGVLGADVPGLDRYLQSHTIAAVPPATDWPSFDGFSAGWYADDDAYARSMVSPEWAAIGADSDNLFDTPFFWGMSAFVDEHVVAAPLVGGVKLGGVVRFGPGGGDRWVAEAGPLLSAVPGVAGVVLDVAGDAIGVEGRTKDLELGFSGVAEVWFEDRTTLTRSLASPEWQAAREAASGDDASWAVMEERLVKDDIGDTAARVAAGG
jgi:uncharacterized protein (TIGR02118 family)